MQNFMMMLLVTSATMSVIILLYMAASPLLAKRYSEKGRYYAWLIIVIGLIIPFRPQLDIATTPIIQMGTENPISVPVTAPIIMENAAPVAVVPPFENPVPVSSLPSVDWSQIGFIVWLAGLFIFLTYHVVKHYRFMKLVNRWSENIKSGQTLEILQSLKSEMGISKEIGLYKCEGISSPMMIGFINPRILLPKTNFFGDDVRFILKHELVHYSRKDLYYKSLVLIATAIHWFNPIVYIMAKIINVECELSCDVETVKHRDINTRRHYSETIMGIAKEQSNMKTALSTNFYGGKKGMRKRIFTIMDIRKKKIGIAVFCAVLTLTLGIGSVFAANESTSSNQYEFDTYNYQAIEEIAEEATQNSEPQSPYRLATTLEEVRYILSLQDGTIPVTNVYVPEIINGQANGIVITEQDIHEALAVLNEKYRMDREAFGDYAGAITHLVTPWVRFSLTYEEQAYYRDNLANRPRNYMDFLYDIVLEAALSSGDIELSANGGVYAETFDHLREEARRIFESYSQFIWPVPNYNRVASGFGIRVNPITGREEFHTGIDIPAPMGTDIIAVYDGIVTFSGWLEGFGNTVILYHGNGLSTLYAQNMSHLVSVDDNVTRGQIIALVGSTGESTGPHLHFEVRLNNEPIDPMLHFQ